MDDQEAGRVNRALKKAILRRNECIRNIRAIHELAWRCIEDEDLVPQLVVLLSEVKELWTAFTTESNTVIDCLVDLSRDSEYPMDQVAELRELTYSRATAHRYGEGVSVDNENLSVRNMSNFKPARLPEIPLPIFHGCLRDKALEAIAGVPVCGDNYQLAWAKLTARFDKPRLVASSLIEQLLNAPKSVNETLIDLNKFLLTFEEGVSVLESMKIPDLGDFILFSLASRCLPSYSIKLFEAQLANGFPTDEDLLSFVKSRIRYWSVYPVYRRPQSSSLMTSTGTSKSNVSCPICKGSNAVSTCNKFTGWTVDVRENWARENRCCFRCLRIGHWAPECKSSVQCTKCPRRHHPLLHSTLTTVISDRDSNPTCNSQLIREETTAQSSIFGSNAQNSSSVVLGTALIHIRDWGGMLHTKRALIDSASQISAITVDCAAQLGLRVSRWTAPISGLSGTSVQNVKGQVNCNIQPRFATDQILKFTAWVFPTITAQMPSLPISDQVANKYKNLALADPSLV
ncbi:PREDICTED: uncharacterized protein LOC107170490 [Diuraphis noxia]|uniref:uncharacterized protein LOC107170490 n=1 Tax=Diuraphis noxia TaxID=143948 RepID=UPI0007635F31|nr:PREDICTED: uncharacterized protein LOC107170490 [Diuraphis noxia]